MFAAVTHEVVAFEDYTNMAHFLDKLTFGYVYNNSTAEPRLKDHPVHHKHMISQDRWSLVTGSSIHGNVGPSARNM